ncbi:hypothetical protein Q3G72_016841 [Acer saccharum]|nr:hypothetical protein Q3G72_016841 [Acer saccharum]
MANPSHMLFVIGLCVSVTLLNPFTCYANYYFFIFGDSLYDPGNNQYVSQGYIPAYHKPYGTTFFNHSTGRFSDGRVVPDFIAANLNLPFIPPYLEPGANFTNGASFASAGGGVLDTNPEAIYFANIHRLCARQLHKIYQRYIQHRREEIYDPNRSTNRAMGDRIDNPAKFGFREGGVACCGTGLCVSVTLLNPFTCCADNYFFILGDSLYDVGNNQYIAEPGTYLPQYHKPYGTTFLNHATGRYSDGRAPPDFIASKLNMSFIPPILEPEADFTNGASFASGGAGVFDNSTQAR